MCNCILIICKLLDSDAGEAAWNYCGPQLHASCCTPLCVRHGNCSCSPRISNFSFIPQPPRHLCKFIKCVMLAVADYDGLRKETAVVFDAKVGEVKDLVSKLQKTQKAVEQALDQYEKSCSM